MTRTLRIPNEPRFVRAFALAIDPGDTLSLLLEIGALATRDLTIVRRTREALDPAYDRAGERKDWEQVHAIGVLREALAEPDAAAYLAYQAAICHAGQRPAPARRSPGHELSLQRIRQLPGPDRAARRWGPERLTSSTWR